MIPLDIVSDTVCPWCYIGKRHLAAAVATLSAENIRFDVAWRPFQLNPAMPAAGLERRAFRTARFGSWERALALDARVAEAGHDAGLAFRHDWMGRTPNTAASHVLIAFAREAGGAEAQDRVVEALFDAYFTAGGDIGDPSVLATIAAGCGLDRERASEVLAEPARRQALARDEHRWRGRGIGGVPSFVLDGRLLFSGARAAGELAEALRTAVAAQTA